MAASLSSCDNHLSIENEIKTDSTINSSNKPKIEVQIGEPQVTISYHNNGIPLQNILNKHTKGQRKIIIDKSGRLLQLYVDKDLLKEYRVGLGLQPKGDKEREGDGKTPEGKFYVTLKFPKSKYYKGIQISYPNKEDAERGLENNLINKTEYFSINSAIDNHFGPPQRTKLGGFIQIHGNGSSGDWTLGCIALDNKDIDEVYEFAQPGWESNNYKTEIVIRP